MAGLHRVEARGGPVRLLCTGPVDWSCQDGAARASFAVSAGDTLEFRLRYLPVFGSSASTEPSCGQPTVADTAEAWRSWVAEHTGYDGAYPEEVRRSSIVLQGLTYQPSGAVVAAATTSLPEELGGDLNFDYRFAWLRDLSLTVPVAVVRRLPARASATVRLVRHRRWPQRWRTRTDRVRRRGGT